MPKQGSYLLSQYPSLLPHNYTPNRLSPLHWKGWLSSLHIKQCHHLLDVPFADGMRIHSLAYNGVRRRCVMGLSALYLCRLNRLAAIWPVMTANVSCPKWSWQPYLPWPPKHNFPCASPSSSSLQLQIWFQIPPLTWRAIPIYHHPHTKSVCSWH